MMVENVVHQDAVCHQLEEFQPEFKVIADGLGKGGTSHGDGDATVLYLAEKVAAVRNDVVEK
eukprot:6680824-Ditylum_brightwellii.AAC.1